MTFLLSTSTSETEIKCYHCGEDCPSGSVNIDDKYFCCLGCKTVYEILIESNLCQYYDIDETPGITQRKLKSEQTGRYDYLNDPMVISRLLDFTDGKLAKVSLFVPQMHCSFTFYGCCFDAGKLGYCCFIYGNFN